MSVSTRNSRKIAGVKKPLVATLVIAAMLFPSSSSQAEVMESGVRRLLRSVVELLPEPSESLLATGLKPKPQTSTTPAQRAMQITHFRLCPRKLSLYAGEDYTLVPIALDKSGETVHGVSYDWQTSNAAIASVSGGTVEALSPGTAVVTVSVGTAKATVAVVVLPGPRPRLSDAEWNMEHTNDCTNPEDVALNESDKNSSGTDKRRGAKQQREFDEETDASRDFTQLAKPAVVRRENARSDLPANLTRVSFAQPTKSTPEPAVPQGVLGLIDGDGGDPIASQVSAYFSNAIGNTRFGPQETAMGSANKTKNNLGSYNYSFAAPVISLPGRGINVDLAMIYNSRVWSLDNNSMNFNYNKGWPAAGWSLGYGRLIPSYDVAGNWLLLGPDGSRTHLSIADGGSIDGSFISFNPNNGKVWYPDGTFVDFDPVNNRWLPTLIRTPNGQKITISYKPYPSFPFRWAIDSIYDTVGRYIQFNYDPTTRYLTSITAPDQGSGTRTLVQISYQTITLQYNFSSGLTVNAPASGSQLDVVRRVYYPQTGRGYVFPDYGSYAMARKVSMRIGMTATNDGTEVAYTNYNYVDVNTQVGQLNDSPQYTTRSEWWQDKTDINGNPTTAATSYTYSREPGTDADGFITEVDTVTNTDSNLKIVTTTGNDSVNRPFDFGHVTSVKYKDLSGNLLQRTSYVYAPGPGGGVQVYVVQSVVDGGQETKTTYEYGTWGGVVTVDEYGFSTNVQRRTTYTYIEDASYISASLLRLVKRVRVYDGSDLSTPIARTDFTFDDYGATGGMISPTPLPPNHDSSFNSSFTTRGNVTKVSSWINAFNGPTIDRYTQYDIFGNVRKADVSCCKSKSFSLSDSTTHYSQPDSVTDGTPNVAPFLTTSFAYDGLNTGLVLSTTDPQNRTTSFHYDSAWRLDVVTPPGSAFTTTTQFDKDTNGNDLLAYSQKVSYTDTDNISKTITSETWFDGAGRVIRAGSGQGSTPSSFDVVKTLYDPVGRMLKQSNPYSGDASGNGSPAYWTTNTYDPLSRVKIVTLPDNQTIQTAYASAVVTVTDQVGRERQSQVDGLGRLISVTEEDPANGALSLVTNYGYNTLDNLISVNQGGQTRGFVYDALSRMTSQTTPEGGAVSFTYTDFGAVLKRTDARNVETHYKYDTLNRSAQVWYTGLGGSDDPNGSRPPLPSGVAATSDVIIAYNNLTSAGSGNGEVNRIDDGAGFETYSYDSLSRPFTKTRTIDGVNSYQSQYQYNAINQLSLMIYPSGKRMRMNHDLRGRFSGEVKVNTSGTVLTSYVSAIGYNAAGQVTGMTSGSGVSESYSYSSDRLQLTRQTATKSASTLMDLNYSYAASAGASGVGTTAGNTSQLMAIGNNPSGQPSTVNGQNRNETYAYDDLGRLASASGFYPQKTYSYDRWGNRTGVTGGASQTVTFQHQPGAPAGVPNNQIATVNGISYAYDAAGNLTSDGVHSYQYDAEGRIAKVDAGTFNEADYFYDAGNRRVKKVTSNNAYTTYCIWEGGQVIAEYGNAPASGGATSYYLADRLSTRMTTDSNGAFKGTQDQLPFGEEGGTNGTSEKHRFTNYERDSETGTDYAMNRQHSTGTGRFMRPDPSPGSRVNPQSLNRYSYSVNDPVDFADPLGLETCLLDSIVTPCNMAFEMLRAGAAVIYNGSLIVNIGGSLGTIRFDPKGNLIGTIRVAENSASSGMYLGQDENGEQYYHIGVTERTRTIVIPFADLPVGLQYRMGYIPRELETDWGTQLLIGAGLGGAIRGVAGIGAGVAANGANATVRFGQKGVSETFRHGEFAGRTIDEVAAGLRSGAISPSQLPVQVIERSGAVYTLNNRSLMALRLAGLEPTAIENVTGNAMFESLLNQRLTEMGGDVGIAFRPVIRR